MEDLELLKFIYLFQPDFATSAVEFFHRVGRTARVVSLDLSLSCTLNPNGILLLQIVKQRNLVSL